MSRKVNTFLNAGTLKIGGIVLAGLVVLFLTGCPVEEDDSVSMRDRVSRLETDLNQNYDNVYKNWHPDTTTRQAAANPDTLESEFPSSESGSYAFSSVDIDNDARTGTALLNSDITYNDEGVSFEFKKDGDDWMILSLSGTGVTLNTVD